MADEARAQGNKLFGEKKYKEALEAYATGVAADPLDHKLRANRSACYGELATSEWKAQEKVELWHSALTEATASTTLETGKEWAKGFLRKATAEFNIVGAVIKWEERKLDDEKWGKTKTDMKKLDETDGLGAEDEETEDLGVAGRKPEVEDDAEDEDEGGAIVDDPPPKELDADVVKVVKAVTYADCEATCRTGLALDPESVALKERLQSLRDAGHATNEEEDRKLVKTEAADAIKKDGNADFVAKRYAQAAEIYTRALAQNPFSHVLLSNRSACYASTDDCDKALRDAAACVSINPAFAKGYSRKATALYLLGRYVEAEASAKAGLEVDAENAALKEILEKAQVETKESPEFQKQIHQLRQKNRQDAKMQALLKNMNFGGNVKMFGGGADGMAGLQNLFGGGGGGGGFGGSKELSEAQMRQMAHAMSGGAASK